MNPRCPDIPTGPLEHMCQSLELIVIVSIECYFDLLNGVIHTHRFKLGQETVKLFGIPTEVFDSLLDVNWVGDV